MSLNAPDFAVQVYLSGVRQEGIEIGPLHNPTPLPPNCSVRYVDCHTKEELEAHYAGEDLGPLCDIDVIDEGETLATFADGSQDFVVASHVIEHFPNPLLALENMLRVLRNTGILFLVAPDKRYSFDVMREVTPFEHVVRDYEQGPEWSRRMHAEDNTRNNVETSAKTEEDVRRLVDEEMARDRSSFHHHVWSAVDFVDFLMRARGRLGLKFQIEFMMHQGVNIVAVLRKDDDESVLAANLEALRSTDPGLVTWLESLDDRRELCNRTVTSRIAYIGNTSVHDLGDPEGEARRLTDDWLARSDPSRPVEVLGFGLGFHVEALLSRVPADREVRVRLLDRVMFQLALRRRDLRHVLSDTRLRFVPEIDTTTAFVLPSIRVE